MPSLHLSFPICKVGTVSEVLCPETGNILTASTAPSVRDATDALKEKSED